MLSSRHLPCFTLASPLFRLPSPLQHQEAEIKSYSSTCSLQVTQILSLFGCFMCSASWQLNLSQAPHCSMCWLKLSPAGQKLFEGEPNGLRLHSSSTAPSPQVVLSKCDLMKGHRGSFLPLKCVSSLLGSQPSLLFVEVLSL